MCGIIHHSNHDIHQSHAPATSHVLAYTYTVGYETDQQLHIPSRSHSDMKRHLHSEEWVTVEGVTVRGRAFCGASLLAGEALAARVHAAVCRSSPTETLDRVCEVGATLEGFFAVFIDATACEHTERSYLIADGARSIPLYYDLDGSIVSDRGCTVQRAISRNRNLTTENDPIADRDPITESELLLTRYVTGPETIWSRIYTTQPGEVVAIAESTRKRTPNDLTRRTYREYWPGE
jgi:asparagine synthase (glutamine-hydrolysing)